MEPTGVQHLERFVLLIQIFFKQKTKIAFLSAVAFRKPSILPVIPFSAHAFYASRTLRITTLSCIDLPEYF